MNLKHRIVFVTIVPSPYQRDLFGALAAREDVELSVCYLEAAVPESPWPAVPLRSFERILPGFCVPFAGARWYFNGSFPDFSAFDFVVLSSYSSWTGQWLMRLRLRRCRWLFWGERLRAQSGGWRAKVQRWLTAPFARATAIVGMGRLAEQDYARRFPGPRHFCLPYHCDLAPFLAAPRPPAPGAPPHRPPPTDAPPSVLRPPTSGPLLPAPRSKQRFPTDAPLTFLFCGQMIRRKGVDLLLHAFERLVGQGADIRLLLVGREADLPEFLSAVSPAARARISYEGFQAPERLPEYFARSHVFVLPSRHDGWGVVINQALGAGLPVISSDAAGAGLDLVEENVNGLRFAAGDVDGLQRAMERFAANPDLARTWGEASRRKALDLTPAAGAEKWVQIFNRLRTEK